MQIHPQFQQLPPDLHMINYALTLNLDGKVDQTHDFLSRRWGDFTTEITQIKRYYL